MVEMKDFLPLSLASFIPLCNFSTTSTLMELSILVDITNYVKIAVNWSPKESRSSATTKWTIEGRTVNKSPTYATNCSKIWFEDNSQADQTCLSKCNFVSNRFGDGNPNEAKHYILIVPTRPWHSIECPPNQGWSEAHEDVFIVKLL